MTYKLNFFVYEKKNLKAYTKITLNFDMKKNITSKKTGKRKKSNKVKFIHSFHSESKSSVYEEFTSCSVIKFTR